jgi:hypothetical protein
MNLNHHFWTINKQFVLDVLKYELGSDVTIIDASYRNDECPSFEISYQGKEGKLYLPSHYEGEFSNYMFFEEKEFENMDDIKYYCSSNLGEILQCINNHIF